MTVVEVCAITLKPHSWSQLKTDKSLLKYSRIFSFLLAKKKKKIVVKYKKIKSCALELILRRDSKRALPGLGNCKFPALPCAGGPSITTSPPLSFPCLMISQKDMKILVMTDAQIRLRMLLWATTAALRSTAPAISKSIFFLICVFLKKSNDPQPCLPRHNSLPWILQNFNSTRGIWCP